MMRAFKIIHETIHMLGVSLKDKIVLTEVGSNNYIFTPIIPSLCGAEKVYAVAKDSRHGNAKDIIRQCELICQNQGVNNITFLENELSDSIIKEADIVTNSGNLRPLDETKLKHLKPTAVIPLMFEAWEIRNEDIDIDYCKKHKIQIAGTWENHPLLSVFDYSGLLAMKMAFNAGFEIMGNKIIVWSDDHFGEIISEKFVKEGATVIQTCDVNIFYEHLATSDVVFITDYDEEREYFNAGGVFDVEKIKLLNADIVFIHLYGKINAAFCKANNVHLFPATNGHVKTMTFTLGDVGLIPILRLQVAGFKVAQEMIENKLSKLSQAI